MAVKLEELPVIYRAVIGGPVKKLLQAITLTERLRGKTKRPITAGLSERHTE
jgi:hypothetical protein